MDFKARMCKFWLEFLSLSVYIKFVYVYESTGICLYLYWYLYYLLPIYKSRSVNQSMFVSVSVYRYRYVNNCACVYVCVCACVCVCVCMCVCVCVCMCLCVFVCKMLLMCVCVADINQRAYRGDTYISQCPLLFLRVRYLGVLFSSNSSSITIAFMWASEQYRQSLSCQLSSCFVCLCVYLCVCVCVYFYVLVYVPLCVCACVCVCVCVYTCTHMPMYACVCVLHFTIYSLYSFDSNVLYFLFVFLTCWHVRMKKNYATFQEVIAFVAVWVSEIMCQQTQVATVIDYYNRWMKVSIDVWDWLLLSPYFFVMSL